MKYLVLFREPDISQEVVENRYLWSTLLDVPSYGMVVEGGGCVLWLISLPPVFEADANGTKRIPVTNLSQLHKNSLVSVDPPSGQDPSLTEILLTDLKPDTQYNATIYSQAANGTEGQPRNKVFKTSRLDFVKWIQPEFYKVLSFAILYLNYLLLSR